MSNLQASMIAEARARHGEIQPCEGKRSLEECFTEERGMLLFWCNSPDGSTRVITHRSAPCRS